MSKNVSRKRVDNLNEKLFQLQKMRMEENDLEHFKRFEEFIEQESLSDQRFGIYDRYDLVIPKNYIVVNSVGQYSEFLKRWDPEKNGRTTVESGHTKEPYEDFSDSDFYCSEQLLPGKTYQVTEYQTRYHNIRYVDCLSFLNNEKAGLFGLPSIYALLDLDRERISFKSSGAVFISLPILQNKNGIFFAERTGSLVRVGSSHKGYLAAGSVIVTLKEKISS